MRPAVLLLLACAMLAADDAVDRLVAFLAPGQTRATVAAAMAQAGAERYAVSWDLATEGAAWAELIHLSSWDHLELRYTATHDAAAGRAPDPRDVLLAVRRHRFADLVAGLPADEAEALASIQGVASIGTTGFAPVRLVRCVNLLRHQGEARANTLLLAYLRLVSDMPGGLGRYHAIWAHDLDGQRVILVARLLYGPTDGVGVLPAPALGAPSPALPDAGPALPILPLLCWRDLPLLLVGGYALDGEAEPAATHLELCRAAGSFRTADLTPSDDPLRAVDACIASPLWWTIYGARPDDARRMTRFLRGQARACAVEAVPELLDLGDPSQPGMPETAWAANLEAVDRAGLHWDAAGQRYQRQR